MYPSDPLPRPLKEALDSLRRQFIRDAGERLDLIARLLDRLGESPTNVTLLKDLTLQFHTLAGSADTHGLGNISSLARQAEERCQALAATASPSGADFIQWNNLLDSLRAEFARERSDQSKIQVQQGSPKENLQSRPKPFELLIAVDDDSIRQTLTRLAEREGMLVHCVENGADALGSFKSQIPDGLIVNPWLADGSGYRLVEQFRSLPHGEASAVLIVDGTAKFLDKVEAIRSGADAFFHKPFDWEALMRRLQHLLERDRLEIPGVLYVEDDPDQASYVQAILESARYRVCVCSDPRDFESNLVSFRPDLVLLDILLPTVSGYELARYLRQDERYATLPTLFLTSQSQDQAKIESVLAGGDDRLVKPVSAAVLLNTVAARLERCRYLKSLLERDGLTRLLTHCAFLERAKALVARKQRNVDEPAALAMADIDHFKSVNDRYGHAAGDGVLSSLASLFRRRLRRSDVIGRYGGDEFPIIIDDLHEQDALRLMSGLLEEFSSIEHNSSDGSTFRATFSAGIAMLDALTMDLEQWKQAADKALYSAKAAGRNRVVVRPR